MGEELALAAERPYWETIDYKAANQIIKGNMLTGQRAVITIGYYLKHIRDNKLFLDGGYATFREYVKEEYGLSESAASRNIKCMEMFSEGGNTPKLAAQYSEYGSSQLREMLYLTDEQREQVTPDTTVREIREMRKPESVEELPAEPVVISLDQDEIAVTDRVTASEPEPVTVTSVELPSEEEGQEETAAPMEVVVELPVEIEMSAGPKPCITGQSGSGLCGAAAYCSEPVECCAACNDKCNEQCGWIEEKPKEIHDDRWFVEQLHQRTFICQEAAKVCAGRLNDTHVADTARSVQKTLAPYGFAATTCNEYSYTCYGYSNGVDMRIGKEMVRLTYYRFTTIIMEMIKDGTIQVDIPTAKAKEEKKLAMSQEITAQSAGPVLPVTPVEDTCPALVPELFVWDKYLNDMPRFRLYDLGQKLAAEEKELKEYIALDAAEPDPDKYIPVRLMQNQQMIVAGLRLLYQLVVSIEEQED